MLYLYSDTKKEYTKVHMKRPGGRHGDRATVQFLIRAEEAELLTEEAARRGLRSGDEMARLLMRLGWRALDTLRPEERPERLDWVEPVPGAGTRVTAPVAAGA
jgi:hypothetical protein